MTAPTHVITSSGTTFPSAASGDLALVWAGYSGTDPGSPIEDDFTEVGKAENGGTGLWVGQRIVDGTEAATYTQANAFSIWRNAALVTHYRERDSKDDTYYPPNVTCARDSVFLFALHSEKGGHTGVVPTGFTSLQDDSRWMAASKQQVTRGIPSGGDGFGSTTNSEYGTVGVELVHTSGPPDTTSEWGDVFYTTDPTYPGPSIASNDIVFVYVDYDGVTDPSTTITDDFFLLAKAAFSGTGIWVGYRRHDGTEDVTYGYEAAGFVAVGGAWWTSTDTTSGRDDAYTLPDIIHTPVSMHLFLMHSEKGGHTGAHPSGYTDIRDSDMHIGGYLMVPTSGHEGGQVIGSTSNSEWGAVAIAVNSSPPWCVGRNIRF